MKFIILAVGVLAAGVMSHATSTVWFGSPARQGVLVAQQGVPQPNKSGGRLVTETPTQADELADSVGFNTHFNFANMSYVLEYPAVSAALLASGVRHIRDGASNASNNVPYLHRLAALGAAGIDHSDQIYLTATAQQIRASLAAYAPYVRFVEPMNEYDTYRDPDWTSKLGAEQELLYATVHDDPAYKSITVLGPSLANYGKYNELGPLDAYEDAGNLHYSTCNYEPGTGGMVAIKRANVLARAATVTKPIWTTETGYNDDPNRGCYLPDSVIAKYAPRTVAEFWREGERHVFFYEFADQPTEKFFGSEGFVHTDGSPKPQYTAIKSFLSLVSDRGAPFITTPLSYALNAPPNVHHILLQKRNGSYLLLLWQEVRDFDPGTKQVVAFAPITVTVRLNAAPQSAVLTTLKANEAAESTRIRASTAMQIPVTDEVSYLELRP